MSTTLIEVCGHIVFSFTRGVTQYYKPAEPECTSESFGYNPLESTGREWYCRAVDELIYQEYSDREAKCLDYITSSSFLSVTQAQNACAIDSEENQDKKEDEREQAMMWKQLRPSLLVSVCKSMYVGGLISLIAATIIGIIYILVTFLSFKTVQDCQFNPIDTISVQMQWTRTLSDIVSCGFLYIWLFVLLLLLFRPFQLMGMKTTLFLVCFLIYCLDTLYRILLQALGISHSNISYIQKIPLNSLFIMSSCLQIYVLTKYFCTRLKQKLTLFLHMVVPGCSCFLAYFMVASLIYPAYNKQKDRNGRLIIALFSPLIGVFLKVISRICAQRLYNITHPGYSFVILSPLYCGSAVVFRILQADLGSLKFIASLGIIHGFAEVIERSTMVVIDHICHMLYKRKTVPMGCFRTPRRERLCADIAIMSMLYESSAIVSVTGYLYLYKFLYMPDESFLHLFKVFAIHTSVQLVIEWFFTSVSLAIETRYQNMPVMAVWRRRWKKHILVAIVNAVPFAMWTSTNLLAIVHGRYHKTSNKPCKMPFTQKF